MIPLLVLYHLSMGCLALDTLDEDETLSKGQSIAIIIMWPAIVLTAYIMYLMEKK